MVGIKTKISGQVIFTFEEVGDLTRLLSVLDNGLAVNPMFNEDVQELADAIRRVIEGDQE
jgi:hypothetical protein